MADSGASRRHFSDAASSANQSAAAGARIQPERNHAEKQNARVKAKMIQRCGQQPPCKRDPTENQAVAKRNGERTRAVKQREHCGGEKQRAARRSGQHHAAEKKFFTERGRKTCRKKQRKVIRPRQGSGDGGNENSRSGERTTPENRQACAHGRARERRGNQKPYGAARPDGKRHSAQTQQRRRSAIEREHPHAGKRGFEHGVSAVRQKSPAVRARERNQTAERCSITRVSRFHSNRPDGRARQDRRAYRPAA